MSAQVKEKVHAWAAAALASVEARTPISVHVNAFLGELSSGASPVGDGIDLFAELSLFLDLVHFKPVLVIPLGASSELDVCPVSWSEAPGKLSLEPPSLYLLSREVDKFLERAEEYRCPIEPPALPGIKGEYASYYRCYRGAKERRWGWEFERCLYLEAYPSELLFVELGA